MLLYKGGVCTKYNIVFYTTNLTRSFNWVLITQKNIRTNKNKISSCATLWYDYLLFGENRYLKKTSLYVFIQFKTPQNVQQVTNFFPDFFCTKSIDCQFCIKHIRTSCYTPLP